jgi:hypothetical protein
MISYCMEVHSCVHQFQMKLLMREKKGKNHIFLNHNIPPKFVSVLVLYRHEVSVCADDIRIVHMGDDIVVVNKPASIPVGRLFLKCVSHSLSFFLPFPPFYSIVW